VARAYLPGAKGDHVLIFEGPQRSGKSSAVAALAADAGWFSEEISDLGSKDAAQDLRGKWLVELAELSAMKRSEVERVKAFVSRRVDHYRPSYGRRSLDHPRQCVFIGTTNADSYFGDEAGNLRYWPVKVGTIDLDALRRDRDLLWAEATAAFKAGEPWHLNQQTEALAAEAQAERRIVDPWEEALLDWAEKRSEVTVEGALEALGLPKERYTQPDANRAARILRANGWTHTQVRRDSRRVRVYRRPVTGAEQVSRVPESLPVTENPSEYNAVTGVTGKNNMSAEQGPEGTGDSLSGANESRCDTRDTRPPTCRRCGEPVDTSQPGFLPFADGSYAHDGCEMDWAERGAGAGP
jgi:predicted P-loop ATPase